MRKNMFLVLLILVAAIFISNEALAAWTQAKGHSYNQLTFSRYKTTKKATTLRKDADLNIVDTNSTIDIEDSEEFNDYQLSYYGEYGIIDTLTVFLSGGWHWIRSNDNLRYAEENGPTGIGDINVGLRQKLIDNILGTGILSSIQGELKIPEAYDYDNPVTHQSLGDGQYDFSLALLFGRGFSKGYSVFTVKYKWRFENDEHDPLTFKPSDQFSLALNGGYSITSWASLRGNVQFSMNVGNAEVSDELLAANWATGGAKAHDDTVVIKDTLGLESDILSAGVDLALSITPKIQTVLSYNRDLEGFGDLRSRDANLGETMSIALVYMH